MINVLLWLVLGSLTGLTIGRRMGERAPGARIVDITVGVLSAVFFGTVSLIFDTKPLGEFSIWSLLTALVGSAITVIVVRLMLVRSG
jgi:uncharacterized membrane protein YeaQ/YmgE (transglycosylase-associated protein family)